MLLRACTSPKILKCLQSSHSLSLIRCYATKSPSPTTKKSTPTPTSKKPSSSSPSPSSSSPATASSSTSKKSTTKPQPPAFDPSISSSPSSSSPTSTKKSTPKPQPSAFDPSISSSPSSSSSSTSSSKKSTPKPQPSAFDPSISSSSSSSSSSSPSSSSSSSSKSNQSKSSSTVVIDLKSPNTTPSSSPSSAASPPVSSPASSTESSHNYTSLTDLKALGELTEWGDLLTPYIITPQSYHPHIVQYYDDHSVVIGDKYPKAKHHLLVMPPYEVYGFDCLTLDSVPMLEEMRDRGLALIEEIRTKEPELSFRMGFHAIPSLKQIHMHVISQDFSAPALKSKKHWNSFNTDFFVDANLFIHTLQAQGYIFLDAKYYNEVMKQTMHCNKCGEEFRTVPRIKEHALSCGTEQNSNVSNSNSNSESMASENGEEETPSET